MLSLGLALDDENMAIGPLLAGLAPSERDQYARLHPERRRRQYLLSRWLLRRHLAGELGADPDDLEIRYPPGQAPRCPDAPRRLGLSHSGPACLSLIGGRAEAGCDIEAIRGRHFAPERLADLHFDRAENQALRAALPDERTLIFHQLWTLKEAHYKALGLGLGAGLAQPAFTLSPRLHCLRAPADGPWLFATLALPLSAGHFALAAATKDIDATIELRRFQPPEATGKPFVADWQSTVAGSRGG